MQMRLLLPLALLMVPACSAKTVQMIETNPVPAPSRILMKGMYTHMADAGRFTPCGAEATYPVAMEADNAALERGYGAASTEPGAPMLVTLYGHVEARPPMEGDGVRETLIVETFVRAWPEETCLKSDVGTTLDNTYWKLVELEGATVVTPPDQQRETHLLLRTDQNQVGGFAGCNSLAGNYVVKDDSLSFHKLAHTLMACPNMDEETAFLRVLGRVKTYIIQGESLDLRDETGSLARFRAVYLR